MDRAALDAAYAAAARYLEGLHARPVGSAAALRLLGLGDACVVKVKSDSQGRMLPEALREALRAAEGAPVIISALFRPINRTDRAQSRFIRWSSFRNRASERIGSHVRFDLIVIGNSESFSSTPFSSQAKASSFSPSAR